MILYQYTGGDGVGSISPPCLKVDLALRATGAPFEIENCLPAKARKVSRTGRLPAVRFDDGAVVEDSICILDELERRYPDAALAPADRRERSIDLLWESFCNDHLYWYGYWIRWVDPESSRRFVDALFGRAPWWIRNLGAPIVVRRNRERARQQGVSGRTGDEVHARIVRALDLLEAGIEGGPFLQGRRSPARGDFALASFTVQVGFRGSMPTIEAEVRARPALVRQAAATYRACGAPPTRWLASVAPEAEAGR